MIRWPFFSIIPLIWLRKKHSATFFLSIKCVKHGISRGISRLKALGPRCRDSGSGFGMERMEHGMGRGMWYEMKGRKMGHMGCCYMGDTRGAGTLNVKISPYFRISHKINKPETPGYEKEPLNLTPWFFSKHFLKRTTESDPLALFPWLFLIFIGICLYFYP